MNLTKKLIQEIEKKNPIYLRTNRNCETCRVENELCKVNEELKEENASRKVKSEKCVASEINGWMLVKSGPTGLE
jgi:hypothetical protein